MDTDFVEVLKAADQAEAQGDVETALRLLRQASSQPEAPAEPWYRLGRLLADLGRDDEARAALQGALARDPAHIAALELLVEITTPDSDPDAVLPLIQAAAQAGVPDAILRPLREVLYRAAEAPPPPEDLLPEPPDLELFPDDADLVRFMAFFGGREDVYARQWYSPAKDRGGYSPVHEPLTPSVLRRHFMGEVTLGVYPIRLDGTCTFAALDLDIPPSVLDTARADLGFAKRLAVHLQQATVLVRDLLRELGFTVIVEDSGYKGRHLWLPFDSPVPARILKEFGETFVASIPSDALDRTLLACEFFPKQAEARGKGLGNLIKLPLGIHRRSGRRSVFLDQDLAPIRRPFTYLRSLVPTPASAVLTAIETLRAKHAHTETASPVPQTAAENVAEPVDLLPAPPVPPPPWTEADFEADPDVSFLLAACPVLRELVRHALEHGTLTHDARLVLRHSLGHLPSGLLAYNFLHERTCGAEPERLISVLRGNPVSCPKIRARLPDITARVPCKCEFPWAEGTYPHPLLHLSDPSRPELPARIKETQDVDAVVDLANEVRRFTQIIRRLKDLEADRDRMARHLATALRVLPDARVSLAEGSLSLVVVDGVETLEWTPAPVCSSQEAPPQPEPIPFPVPAFRVRASVSSRQLDEEGA